jgi:hypothetical protein
MAADDANRCIKNAIYRQFITVRDTSDNLQNVVAADPEISKDSGSFANAATAVTAIAGATGIYAFDITAAEWGINSTVLQLKPGGALVTTVVVLQPEPALDSGYIQSATGNTAVIAASASATDDLYNGAELEIARGTGIGQIRTVVDYVGSSKTVTLDRAWITVPITTSVYIIHPSVGVKHGIDIVAATNVEQIAANTTAATLLMKLYNAGLISNNVDDVAATTTSFKGASTLSAVDDFYNGGMIVFTSGTLSGLAEKILDYTGSTRLITLSGAMPSAPANGVTFVILGKIK